MDLKNLEGTSTYAIEAVYYTYYSKIFQKIINQFKLKVYMIYLKI